MIARALVAAHATRHSTTGRSLGPARIGAALIAVAAIALAVSASPASAAGFTLDLAPQGEAVVGKPLIIKATGTIPPGSVQFPYWFSLDAIPTGGHHHVSVGSLRGRAVRERDRRRHHRADPARAAGCRGELHDPGRRDAERAGHGAAVRLHGRRRSHDPCRRLADPRHQAGAIQPERRARLAAAKPRGIRRPGRQEPPSAAAGGSEATSCIRRILRRANTRCRQQDSRRARTRCLRAVRRAARSS